MENSNNTGKFRKKRKAFAQVSNHCLQNNEISLKSKGLYALIQSYIDIPDFTLYKSYLASKCSEGERAFDSAWKELKMSGYLVQYKIKTNTGRFVYEYELLDVPVTPGVRNAGVENVAVGNSGVDIADVDNLGGEIEPPINNTVTEKDLLNNINPSINHTNKEMDEIDNSNLYNFDSVKEKIATGDIEYLNYKCLSLFVNELIKANDLNEKMFNEFKVRNNPGEQIIGEIVELLIDLFSLDQNQKINISGQLKNANIVVNKLLRLNFDKVDELVSSLLNNANEIKNPYDYLKTSLYNASVSQGMTKTVLKYPELNSFQ